MLDNQISEHIKKVNKVAALVLWLGAITVLLFFLVSRSIHFNFIYVVIAGFIGAFISSILLKSKKLCSAIPYILFISLLTAAFETMAISNTTIHIFIICFCIVALYLQPKLFIICSGIFNFSFIAAQLYFKISPNMQSFMIAMTGIDTAALILYFLTKWGSELIRSAAEEGKKNIVFLSEAENSIGIITF